MDNTLPQPGDQGVHLQQPNSSLAPTNMQAPSHPPSLRSISDRTPTMTTSSTPLGQINAARKPGPGPTLSGHSSGLSQDIQAKMKAFSLSRQGVPPGQNQTTPGGGVDQNNSFGGSPPVSTRTAPSLGGGVPNHVLANKAVVGGPMAGGLTNVRLTPQARPQLSNWTSAPSVPGQPPPVNPKMGGLAAKRGMNRVMKLSDAGGPQSSGPTVQGSGTQGSSGVAGEGRGSHTDSPFSRYSEFVDTKAGTLNFKNKAVIHGGGIEFTSGRSFSISLDEVDTMAELGKGNYGTVYKVRHSRPHVRRRGLGLRGIVARPSPQPSASPCPGDAAAQSDLSGVIMAMKEIRLELDEAKFTAIIMELDILHRCVSPFIIDFYGAFFQEGAVYICVEYMDGGSVEKLYGDGIPENILRKITLSTIMGLKSLKDEHNIIHRDVKPTNILINTRGQVKICDFGVSGNLVASIAKTNIGCQSYMAPERIAGGGIGLGGSNSGDGTYSVQSDVWSLGLTVIECAMGRYPYPPETYYNIFSQLNAIVQGEPPQLPEHGFSDEARNFVRGCLDKNASLRPSYAMLLRHPWLSSLMNPPSPPARGKPSENGVEASVAELGAKTGKPGESNTALAVVSSAFETSDPEVAEWVLDALGRRERGVMGKKEKPALHTVALDAVPPSPMLEDVTFAPPSQDYMGLGKHDSE